MLIEKCLYPAIPGNHTIEIKREGGKIMRYIYDHKISSDLNIINSAIKNILLDTRRMLDEDLFFDFRLVLNELLINCYEHGNECDCNKKILLKLSMGMQLVFIKLKEVSLNL